MAIYITNLYLLFSGANTVNLLDVVIFVAAVITITLPPILYFSALYLCLDPCYYVIGDIIGYSSYKSASTFTYIIITLVRAFVSFSCFECARTITLTGMIGLHFVDHLKSVICGMCEYKIHDSHSLKCSFIQFRTLSVIFTSIQSSLAKCLTLTIAGGFWGIVISAWMVIRIYNVIPIHMYLIICAMLPLLFVAFVILLTMFTIFCMYWDYLTWRLNMKTNRLYACCKSVSSRNILLGLKKECKSFRIIRFYVYPLLHIDKQFCEDVARNLFEKILDTLLIF